MTDKDVGLLKKEKRNWTCNRCLKERRESMMRDEFGVSGDSGKENLTESVNQLLVNVDTQNNDGANVNDVFDDVINKASAEIIIPSLVTNNSEDNLNKIVGMLNDLKARFETRFDALESSLSSIISENKFLKSRLEVLENKLDKYQQTELKECIDIVGVPLLENENVQDIVCKVLNSVNINVTENQLKSCKRLKCLPNGKPGKICVRLDTVELKNAVLKSKKNKRITSMVISDNIPKTDIFINEALTPLRRRLFAETKKVQKSKNLRYAWIKNGNILVKVKESDRTVIFINGHGDLERLPVNLD